MATGLEGDDSEAVDFANGCRFSIARLAAEFGMARETVSKRLGQAGVQSAGLRNGYPVYRLRDAVPVILALRAPDGGAIDPEALPPEQRAAWYRAEILKREHMKACRQLVPLAEFESELAAIMNDFVQFLATLPDLLEIEGGLTAEQVQRLHDTIDAQREALFQKLANRPAPPIVETQGSC